MKFILHRNHLMTSTLGHTIEFKKDVATHVPPELWNAAQAIGAIPEETLPEAKVAPTREPQDIIARKKAIFDGFEQMILANVRESFTGTGVPHAKSLAMQLGFSIDNKERDALWLEFKQQEAATVA